MTNADDLKKQQLCESLSDKELEKISTLIENVNFSANTHVFEESQPTRGIYMIKKGIIELKRILKLDTKTKMLVMLRNIQSSEIRHTVHGWEHVFSVMKEGHFFGELSVLEGKKTHGADAVATEDTELLLLKTESFNDLSSTDPLLMAKILKTIAKVISKNVRELDSRLLKALTG